MEAEGIKIQGLKPVPDPPEEKAEETPVRDTVKEVLGVDPDYVPSRTYINRPLDNGDMYKFGRVIAIASNDPQIKASVSAVMSGITEGARTPAEGDEDKTTTQRVMERFPVGVWGEAIANLTAFVFVRGSREIQLFLAHLAGIERDFDEAKMEEVRAAKAEGREELSENELINKLNNEILKEFSKLPFTATPDIIAELVEKDDFDPFYKSARLAAGAMGKVFSRLQTTT